ncbi:hypothetical protein Pfo_004998 [Paulownia fortunei]|nr:hypothetical protein Pfo_004998 [Paulownia fortunei]
MASDSYIDPVSKEYGGDKYVNGEILRPREQMSYQQGNAAYNNQGPLHSEARNHGQNYGRPLQQNYSGNFNQRKPGNYYAQGQRDFQQGNLPSHVPPEHRGFSQDKNYGSAEGGSFGQVSGGQRNISSMGNK